MGWIWDLMWSKRSYNTGKGIISDSGPSGIGKVLLPMFAIILIIVLLTGGTLIFKIFNDVFINPVKNGQISALSFFLIIACVLLLFFKSKRQRVLERATEFDLRNMGRR